MENKRSTEVSRIKQVGQKQLLASAFSGISLGKSAHQQCVSPATMPHENATPQFGHKESMT